MSRGDGAVSTGGLMSNTNYILWISGIFLFIIVFHTNFLTKITNMSSLRGGRSGLVKTLTVKMERDRELESLDKTKWYSVDLERIRSQDIRAKFVQLHTDEETLAFIEHSVEQSDWLFTQLWYNVAKSLLSWVYCQTDINAMLSRGSMFVFSKQQFVTMTGIKEDANLGDMLDLGAGDGRPTEAMSGFCDKVFATEMSKPMRKILATKGFEVLEIDNWAKKEEYGLISALNLFDRCDKPMTIVSDIYKSLKPGGYFVVALVLPFRPYVESVPSHEPSEEMNISGKYFENQLESSVEMFKNVGFELLSWSRIPYLCEGDLARPIYSLDDSLIIFRKP